VEAHVQQQPGRCCNRKCHASLANARAWANGAGTTIRQPPLFRCSPISAARDRRRALDALVAAGSAARGTAARRGVTCEPPREASARRPLDQRRDGAGQARGHQSARARRAAGRGTVEGSARRLGRDRRAGLHQSAGWLAARGWAELNLIAARAGRLWPLRHGRRQHGQCRVRFGQSRPGRCTWATAAARCVGDALASAARIRRTPGDHREYYVQRRRRAGRCPRPLGPPALPRSAVARTVGAVPEGLYPGDYLVPLGQALAAEFGDAYAMAPEGGLACALFRTRAGCRDDGHDPRRSGDASASTTICSVPKPNCRPPGKVDAAEAWLRAHDLVYDGELEAPKGKTLEDWEPVALPLFRSTKFGDDQDRPIKKSDGSWTYFARTSPITSRRLKPPTRWWISGRGPCRARWSGSRRRSPR